MTPRDTAATKTTATDEAREEAGVATPAENAGLEHSAGGVTTRDDRHDLGVPMEQGDPREPQGPEDALGKGEKRGDYAKRAGEPIGERPHEAVSVGDGSGGVKTAETEYTGADGKKRTVESIVDCEPVSEVVPQAPRAEQQGNKEPLAKGGVTTEDARAF